MKNRLHWYTLALAVVLLSGCHGSKQKVESGTTMKQQTRKSAAGRTARKADDRPRKPTKTKVKGLPEIWDSVQAVETSCAAHLKKAARLRDKILAAKKSRTAQNTLEPFNELLRAVNRIQPLSELIANVHPQKKVRTAAEKCEQQAKAFGTALMLNRPLYDALKAVDAKGLDPKAKRFRKHLLRDYRRAGVDKDEKTRNKLAALDKKMVKLGQEFSRNIREDKKSMQVTEKDLAGLPADFIKARKKRKAAKGKTKKGGAKDGKITLTTDYPDFFPVQTYAKKARVRRKLYKLYLQRAYPVNAKILKQILTLRHQYASLLGYPDWAQYMAEDKMVKNKTVIDEFIKKVAALARPRTRRDLKEILARKKKDFRRARRVQSWDRFYYVKKIQAERYGVDPTIVRSYFPFKRVKTGLLEIAQELFGVTFEKVTAAPTWHPKVEAYNVLEDGRVIARFYLDLHPRKGKYGHAAEFPIYSGVLGKQIPSAALVTNFPDPEKTGGPALTEHNQVTTFFHEFGHLMHQLLGGRQKWITQSGITCEWDFVEAPSQLLEEWTWDPKVLARFAKHHKTQEPIPAALVKKMRKADEFGKGVHVMRQMFYARLSFAYHEANPKNIDLMRLLKATQKKYSPYPHIPGTAVFANFGHLNGYSSMYYTYMWSLVLAKDLFTTFKENGLMHKKTAQKFRRTILEPGGSVDAERMVKNFLGRKYTFDAFQSWLQKK
jgi:thimet oligopeptidase